MPDVEPTLKQLGVPPTSIRGRKPFYSVPTIYDPSTQKSVTDTIQILIYLEDQYPEYTPMLFPKASRPLQTAFTDTLFASVFERAIPDMLFGIHDRLCSRSQTYFRESRERWIGKRLEEVPADGEECQRVIGAFETVGRWMDMNGGGSVWMMGASMSFSDVAVAAALTSSERVVGSEGDMWVAIKEAEGGRWARFLQRFGEWQTVV
ncbi:hypothetical protein OF83DRAFT_337156 [Amylostereum chailletii]|nr:hypothetical protein OF83DRAFT_337156 [Amylostereum chailletii]